MIDTPSKNIVWHSPTITRDCRQQLNQHQAAVLWFTGLPAAGKSTLAHALEAELYLDVEIFCIDSPVMSDKSCFASVRLFSARLIRFFIFLICVCDSILIYPNFLLIMNEL